jgi:AhpD family alkylhydroperoxidase
MAWIDIVERELIAVAVSAANGCRYCVSHHAAALMFYWRDEERVRRVGFGAPCTLAPIPTRRTRWQTSLCSTEAP